MSRADVVISTVSHEQPYPITLFWCSPAHTCCASLEKESQCLYLKMSVNHSFEKYILAEDKNTSVAKMRKSMRENQVDSPLKPKQVSVGTGSCSHISEDQLICKVIRNEALALITIVIWGVFIFCRKSVHMISPIHTLPIWQYTHSDLHKELSTVKGYLCIQASWMEDSHPVTAIFKK